MGTGIILFGIVYEASGVLYNKISNVYAAYTGRPSPEIKDTKSDDGNDLQEMIPWTSHRELKYAVPVLVRRLQENRSTTPAPTFE